MKLSIATRPSLLLLAAAAVGTTAAAQISFQSPVNYTAGTDPESVAVADFDGDGDVDIAATVRNPPRLSVLRNNGDGTFAAPEFSAMATGSDPAALVARDFNADGHVDLMLTQRDNNNLKYLRNLGDGHFTVQTTIDVGVSPQNIVAGDFDRDGDQDVAITCRGNNRVNIIRNLGGGNFDVVQGLSVGASPRGLAVGRFQLQPETENLLDLVVAAHDSRRIDILHNQGNGSFVLVHSLVLGPTDHPEDVAVADFDGDGMDDIVASVSDTTVHDVVYFRQTAWGVFAPADYFDAGGVHPVGIVACDFDRDTRIDVAVANSTSSNVTILPNIGGGLFASAISFALPGPQPDFVAFGDFDDNRYMDLVVTDDLGDKVSVLLNSLDNPFSYCIAAPNSAGFGAHIASTGTVSIAANDFRLEVAEAPPLVNGVFFFGQVPQQAPFHSGYLCIVAPQIRLGPVQQTTALGTVMRPLDFQTEPASMITAGSVWNFQFWYRDPTSTGDSTNLSDGWRVLFEP
jgi:hypothetical protein